MRLNATPRAIGCIHTNTPSFLRLFCHIPLKRDQLDWDWRMRLNAFLKRVMLHTYMSAVTASPTLTLFEDEGSLDRVQGYLHDRPLLIECRALLIERRALLIEHRALLIEYRALWLHTATCDSILLSILLVPICIVSVCVCVCVWVCVCVCMWACGCVCVCVCVCLCVCERERTLTEDWLRYIGHDSSICGTWLIHMWDMEHIHISDMPHSWLVGVCGTWICYDSYVQHDSFVCVTWLISHMTHVTHASTNTVRHILYDTYTCHAHCMTLQYCFTHMMYSYPTYYIDSCHTYSRTYCTTHTIGTHVV